MVTKEQQTAIKRIFDRGPVYPDNMSSVELAQKAGWYFVHNTNDEGNTVSAYWKHPHVHPRYEESDDIVRDYRLAKPMTYLQFRRTVHQGFDCLMVRWQGMWLGIEPDGYTHS
jgi:hypothetical protein